MDTAGISVSLYWVGTSSSTLGLNKKHQLGKEPASSPVSKKRRMSSVRLDRSLEYAQCMADDCTVRKNSYNAKLGITREQVEAQKAVRNASNSIAVSVKEQVAAIKNMARSRGIDTTLWRPVLLGINYRSRNLHIFRITCSRTVLPALRSGYHTWWPVH